MQARTSISVLRKPLIWAMLYLVLIPFYAAIFLYVLPAGSFYHATLQREPGIQERSRRVLADLWNNYRQFGPSDVGECASSSPLARSVDLSSLRIEGDEVSFYANYYLTIQGTNSYNVTVRVRFPLDRSFDVPYRFPPGKGRGTVFKQVQVNGIDASAWGKPDAAAQITRCMFPSPYDDKLPKNVALLLIPIPLDERIHQLSDCFKGIPRGEKDAFWRMLYLSASTITTTGFGDIVPVTNRARICVTSESLLGIVVIGLFLNAVASRSSRG